MTVTKPCECCGSFDLQIVFFNASNAQITTMNTSVEGTLEVLGCESCGHCQTHPLNDLEGYYRDVYELGRINEEDDQLYHVSNGRVIYRAEQQSTTLLAKVALTSNTRVLDYGCGKSITMKRTIAAVPNLSPYLFDVSNRYLNMWTEFVPREHCAIGLTPPDWDESFDVVTSFFTLEHVDDLESVLRHVNRLLREGGLYYVLVPNLRTNPADLLVADHVNHFCESSLDALFRRSGLRLIDCDALCHEGAIVAIGRKERTDSQDRNTPTRQIEPRAQIDEVRKLGASWLDMISNLRSQISAVPEEEKICIFGAGFYGALIANIVADVGRQAVCFLDSNPNLAGTTLLGLQVLGPEDIPDRVSWICVGLNPTKSRSIISSIPALLRRQFNFIYLDL